MTYSRCNVGTPMVSKSIFSAFAILGVLTSSAIGQTSGSVSADTVALDPQVRRGKLPNGFQYYIRKHGHPVASAEMRLVVKAGSQHEDDDQLGLAHLLEHMAFNGTAHYPHNTLREYFDESGLVPGGDWNGNTSGEATHYWLRLPTDQHALYESGFQIMRDWAQGLTLDSTDIDAERGVVLGESRGSTGASSRLQREMEARLLNHPNYPPDWREKHESNIRSFKHETLRRFYRDWYRPDLEALVVVGDVDLDQAEQWIISLFSDLKMPANPRPAPDIASAYDVKLTGKNQVLVLSGDHVSSTTVRVYMKRKAEVPTIRTIRDYRRAMMDRLYNAMMKARLDALNQRYDAPFETFFHEIDRGTLGSTAGLDALFTYLTLGPSTSFEGGVRVAIAELERVRQHGFLASELTRAKAAVRKELVDEHRTSSSDIVRRLAAYYVGGAAAPHLDYERDLQRRLIDEIDVAAINGMAREWLGAGDDRDVVIMAPTSAVQRLPTEREVEGWFDEIRGGEIAAYVEPEPPVEHLMSAATIGNLKYDTSYIATSNEELGITRLQLRNGIKVVLKPFEPQRTGNGKLALHGFSRGGISLYGDNAVLAGLAADIVRHAGVGSFDKFALDAFLAGKGVSVDVSLDDVAANIRGSSAPAELETMLQLVHLYLSAPRRDSAALEDWKATELAEIERWDADAEGWFWSVIDTTRYRRGLASARRPARQDIERVHEADAYRLYEERFTRPGDFTFILAGDFESDQVLPLLLKYLGSLPATKANKPSRSQERIVARMGKASITVHRGSDEKAEVRLFFSGHHTPSPMAKLKLEVLAHALQIRMRARLREKEGGTYYAGASVDYEKTPGTHAFAVSFTAAIDNVEPMISAAVEEVEHLGTAGLDSALFSAAVARARERSRDRLGNVRFWTSYLAEKYLRDEDPTEILKQETVLTDILTNETLNAAAQEYLSTEHLMRFVLLPVSTGADR